MNDTILNAAATSASLALALSHGAMAVLGVVALLAARDASRTLQGRLLALLALCVAALELSSGPDSASLAPILRIGLGLVGALNVALLWLFCLSILQDDFRLRSSNLTGAAVLTLGPIFVLLAPGEVAVSPLIAALSAAAPFIAIAHIARIAWSERAGDLVEMRRRVRLWIPTALAIAAAVSVLSEDIESETLASIVRNGFATLPVGLLLLLWLAAFDPTRLRFERTFESTARASGIDPRDGALYAALRVLMEDKHVYREPDLTIDLLAERLSAPTHRVRSLINGGLGFRNFGSFINGYRLAHAKAALGDGERARDTILSIAFEAGFASLQTFNRVFREAEGVTPTAYRLRALALTSQIQKKPLIS